LLAPLDWIISKYTTGWVNVAYQEIEKASDAMVKCHKDPQGGFCLGDCITATVTCIGEGWQASGSVGIPDPNPIPGMPSKRVEKGVSRIFWRNTVRVTRGLRSSVLPGIVGESPGLNLNEPDETIPPVSDWR
jgi:hypothetical protein